MRMPKYPKYKDSEAAWLGHVPAHWECVRLASLFREVSEPGNDDLPILSVSIHDGVSDKELGEDEAERKVSRSDDRSKYKAVAPGDLTYNMMRAWQGGFGTVAVPGMVSPAYVVARPTAKFVTSHVESLLRTPMAVAEIKRHSRGITDFRLRLYWEDFKCIRIALPPYAEQQAIADFLEDETAKIDSLISEQQKLIALLAEKRRATISHAVTRGLNPDAPMKDSGVAWLGDVPTHWEVRSISSLSTKITNGYVGPTRDILVAEGVRYLQSLHIKGGRIKFGTPYYVTEEWSLAHQKSILATGDVLIVQTGDIGQVAVVNNEFSGCNCHALIIVSPIVEVVGGDWLALVLNSDFGLHSLLSIQTGALHPHLNCGNVRELYVPVPSTKEQREISAVVDARTAKLDELRHEAELTVALLKERRSALIAAAVTGQVDVRGAATASTTREELAA